AELVAAVRRRGRGDGSDDDEDLGLPQSPPASPPTDKVEKYNIIVFVGKLTTCLFYLLFNDGSGTTRFLKGPGPNGPLHLQCPALQYPGKCNEYNIDLDTTFTVASAPALILQHSINRSL
ncbi:hypothetical protein SFRURICE_000215, partial [Spodoptera frugiperda]